jgi:two-component system LytT family response regulator
MKAIIIDDEPKARRILQALILENYPLIEIVAIETDVPSGVKAIVAHKPDLVFLDVEMPGQNGFQLLDFFEKIDFEIIFTTAHSEYAFRAFEVSAIGYLLKPIQIEKLVEAVERAIKFRGQNQIQQRLQTLQSNFQSTEIKKIALPVSDGLVFVNVNDIIYLKADGAYTQIFIVEGKHLLISKNLKEFENSLSHHPHFFRSHRSYMLNINYIQKYNKTEGGYIELINGHQADLSREKKDEFEKIMLKSKL